MRDYIALAMERIRAAPGMVLAAVIAATVSNLLVTASLAYSAVRSDEPYLQIVHVSLTTPVSAGGTYSDVRVAVDNAGNATAKGCYAKAYNHLLFSNEIDETSALGRSEQFDLSPHGGHVATVGVYLPNISGEALLGGGVRAPVFYRVECANAVSSADSKTVVVPFSVPGSEAP